MHISKRNLGTASMPKPWPVSWVLKAGVLACFGQLSLGAGPQALAQVLSIGDNGQAQWMCTRGQNQNRQTAPYAHRSIMGQKWSQKALAYRAMIDQAAQLYNLSPDLIESVIAQESGFNPKALSPKGAIGLMQLMPATANAYHVDPYDPEQNIKGGTAYLRYLMDMFDGHIDLVLGAYNAGQGAILKYKGLPPYAETKAYLARNLDNLAQKSDTRFQVSDADPVKAASEGEGAKDPSSERHEDRGYISPCQNGP